MWIINGFLAAIFAGFVPVLSKIGVRNVKSNLATAIRTSVVLLFIWVIVLLYKDYDGFSNLEFKNYIYILISGVFSAVSWLLYFRALKLGTVNLVAPIDKSNVILTMILGFIFLGEKINVYIIMGMIFIGIGVVLMVNRQTDEKIEKKKGLLNSWLIVAFLSTTLASVANILAKLSLKSGNDLPINSNLTLALRTIIVIIILWVVVFVSKEVKNIIKIDRKSWLFLFLSGISTSLSWICYFSALSIGNASIVVPLDKLSIVVTIIASNIILKERVTKKGFAGLIIMVVGTLLLIFEEIMILFQ